MSGDSRHPRRSGTHDTLVDDGLGPTGKGVESSQSTLRMSTEPGSTRSLALDKLTSLPLQPTKLDTPNALTPPLTPNTTHEENTQLQSNLIIQPQGSSTSNAAVYPNLTIYAESKQQDTPPNTPIDEIRITAPSGGSSIYSGSTLRTLSSETFAVLSTENEVSDFLKLEEDDSIYETRFNEVRFRATDGPVGRRPSNSGTILEDNRVIPHLAKLALQDFCALIPQCKSLERAQILRVECHRNKGGVYHRFLMFKIRRPARGEIWLRIDRRAGGLRKLIFKMGRTSARDEVQIGVTKAELMGSEKSELENVLTFDKAGDPLKPYPILGEFKFFLDIITYELREYKIWPDNCWFFCSVLQEYLRDSGVGTYTVGRAVNIQTAAPNRSRITTRIYHIPENPPDNKVFLEQIFPETQNEAGPLSALLKDACLLARKATRFPFRSHEKSEETGPFRTLARHLHSLAGTSNLKPKTRCLVAGRAVAIFRHLYYRHPEQHRLDFCRALRSYVPYLREDQRELEAAYCMREVLDVQREQYKKDPSSRSEFLETLKEYLERSAALGQLREACEIQREIIGVFSELYVLDRANHHFKLAAYRRDYASRLKDLGRHEEACAEIGEIVQMTRYLHDSEADNYHDTLISSLHSHADQLEEMGALDQACLIRLEVVEMERKLYRVDATSHRGDLLASLKRYVKTLTRASRDYDACDAQLEIVAVFREAHSTHPELYRPAIEALEASIDRLSAIGRDDEICDYLGQLVMYARYRSFIEPEYRLLFARYLEDYCKRLHATGKMSEAGTAGMEVVKLYHSLWKEEPEKYLRHLDDKIGVLYNALKDDGRASGVSSIQVDVYRHSFSKNQTRDTARTLSNHLVHRAYILHKDGDFTGAASASLDAYKLFTEYPVLPSTSECRARTEQLLDCVRYVAWARHFDEALSIAQNAVLVAGMVGTSTEESQKWANKRAQEAIRKLSDINRVVGLKKKHKSQLRMAQKLNLTYPDDVEAQAMRKSTRVRYVVGGVLVVVVVCAVVWFTL